MVGRLDAERAVRVDDAVDLAIHEGVRAALPVDEVAQRVGRDEAAGGNVPAPDRPHGDHGDLSRVLRVVAALQLAEHGIEVGDLVVEIEVDVPVERIADLLHELVGVQHFAHVDSVLLGDLEGVVSLRLIGEVVGPVVEDAFRGHEEIHGEVLSVGNEGTGPVRSPL